MVLNVVGIGSAVQFSIVQKIKIKIKKVVGTEYSEERDAVWHWHG